MQSAMTHTTSDNLSQYLLRSDPVPEPRLTSRTGEPVNRAPGTRGAAYEEALVVLQAHHDRPGSVAEPDLAHAYLRGYLPHWQRQIRYAAYRQGFLVDDVDTVVDDAVEEFFMRKVVTGRFDPARGEFAVLRTLVQQRAIDRHRHLRSAPGVMNRPGRTDIADEALPVTPSAEDEALRRASSEEEANAELCRRAGLDQRETAIMTYRYVCQLEWDQVLLLVNHQAERPVGLPHLRNIQTNAKRKIRAYLARRTRGGRRMTESWAARLARAMENDDPEGRIGVPAESDPGPGPWDAATDAVADHIIAAAVLGYATDADADAILANPAARQRLSRRWEAAPPSDAITARGTTNAALKRLLTGCGPAGLRASGTANSAPPAEASPGPRPQRLRSLRGDTFTLAAADGAAIRHSQTWSGGRIIRQRLADGTTAITAEYARPDPGIADDQPWALSLSVPTDQGGPLLLMLLLFDPAGSGPAEGQGLVGHAVIAAASAIGELQVRGPMRLSALTDAELGAVPDSVAWSRGPWNTAWRRAAQAAGKGTPLHDAVLRGSRQH